MAPVEENVIKGTFFVTLAKSVEEVSQTETTDKKSRNSSTITNLDTLQGAVPTATVGAPNIQDTGNAQ